MAESHLMEARADSRALPAILAAGLLCGVMDITAAFLIWVPKGVSPGRLLQAIAGGAGGLLGPAAFREGWIASALGLAIHFLIAFIAAGIFYAASKGFQLWSTIRGLLVWGMHWPSMASCTGWSCRWTECAAARSRSLTPSPRSSPTLFVSACRFR